MLLKKMGILILIISFVYGCGDNNEGENKTFTLENENGETTSICIDYDLDGYGTGCELGEDCDDFDPSINPSSIEICGDHIDQNCDGSDLDFNGLTCQDCYCSTEWIPVCVQSHLGGYCYHQNECWANINCDKVVCILETDQFGNIISNSECIQNYPDCLNTCSYGYSCPLADYTFSPSHDEVFCNNPDKTNTYHGQYYDSLTCTWYCADYEDSKGNFYKCAYVSLDFTNEGNGWYLDSEYISSGICY